jgi:thiol:disulfide interchange protein DsbD
LIPVFIRFRALRLPALPSLAAFLGLILCLLSSPACSFGATATVDIIHSLDHYPAGGSYPILFRINIPPPWYLHGPGEGPGGLIPTVLSFSEPEGLHLYSLEFPKPQKKRFPYTKAPLEVFSGEIRVRTTWGVSQDAPAGKQVITGRLSYQACSSKVCLPPEEVPILFSVMIVPRGTRAEPINQDVFKTGTRTAATGDSFPAGGWGTGLWVTLLGIFLGGLALNLTPCVYPLIPITVSYFGGRTGTMGGKIAVQGLLYISGLAFTNSFLGVAASLSVGMLGAVLQNPLVLVMVAAVLVFLASSFFGMWELRLPSGLTRLASRNFGGYFGSFFMGLTLGIVAAPCLGPFILGLLTYVGQRGDPFLGFSYFFVLSLGLGLPLSVLAIFSGAAERLPVSGQWMVWIRKGLGWVLILMAGYLLEPLMPGSFSRSFLTAALLAAAGVHLGWLDRPRSMSRVFPTVKKIVGGILIGAAILVLWPGPESAPGIHWMPYDPNTISRGAVEKRPLILDFYADWCSPCKALEKKVFRDPEVVALSREFLTVRVDLTRHHPQQEEILKRYNIRGVPAILFMNSQGIEERALRIQSFVGPGEMLKRMKRVVGKP